MVMYILKRLGISLLTIFVLLTLLFFLVRTIPGDTFNDPKISAAARENLKRYYGLDQPLVIQYVNYIKNLFKGDLGVALKYGDRPVTKVISETFPVSADVGIRSITFAMILGLTLGCISALNRRKFLDYFCLIIAIVGVSLPEFISGALLQFGFAVQLKWFPIAQWGTFAHTILPTFALSMWTTALVTRLMRANMIDVSNQDYIVTAESKGLNGLEILWRHQIRNAILPVITVIGPAVAAILTGTYIIEYVFLIPGMGKFYVGSLNDLDYTMILGMSLFYGTFLVIANFCVDIAYGFIDPRIRIGK